MRVAVLGSAGFVGSAICSDLDSCGVDVVPLARRLQGASAGVDLGDSTVSWADVLKRADVVINAAGKAHDLRRASAEQAADYWAVNAEGAASAAAGSAAAGAARFIHLSTIKVLGESPIDGMRFREGDPLRPAGVYAESKSAGERLVREALDGTGTDCVIVRLPLVFGTPFKGNLAVLQKAIRRGVPLPLGHRSIGARTYVHMGDLTDLILNVIRHAGPLPPALHARSAPDLTASDVAWLVGAEIGRRPRIVSVPAGTIRRIARVAGKPEIASKLCDPMLVADDKTRLALGLEKHP